MKSVDEYYNELLETGIWSGPMNLIKKNCDKCYNKRNLGKYLNWYERDSDGNVINKGKNGYAPCTCITSRLNKMKEEEKKHQIQTIGTDNLKDI